MLLLISFIYKSHLECIGLLASCNLAKVGDSSKNMDQTHCYTFLSVNTINTFTVATASSYTNRYCFISVLKMSSVIELLLRTGSIFQVCNPKYVADLKKTVSVWCVSYHLLLCVYLIIYHYEKNICFKEYANSEFFTYNSLNVDNMINIAHRKLTFFMPFFVMVMEGTVSQISYLGPSSHVM